MKSIKNILMVSLLFVILVDANETKNINPTIEMNKDSSTELRTVFFPLKRFNAAVIRTKIKPLLGKEAKVISFRSDNMLIVTADPKSIKRVQKVIERIESDKQPFDATVVKFKKTSIKDIYHDIEEMSKSLFPQDIYNEKVSVLDSNITNSLILVGKKENRDKLIKYIELLDIEGGFTSKNIE